MGISGLTFLLQLVIQILYGLKLLPDDTDISLTSQLLQAFGFPKYSNENAVQLLVVGASTCSSATLYHVDDVS